MITEARNESMKAIRIHGPKTVHYENVPMPSVGPDHVLVRVRAAAICATVNWDRQHCFDRRRIFGRASLYRELSTQPPTVTPLLLKFPQLTDPSLNLGVAHALELLMDVTEGYDPLTLRGCW